jgi:hypothetical protein
MRDYTVLKSSKEELLKKAGYAEPHALFKLAGDSKPRMFEEEREQQHMTYPKND